GTELDVLDLLSSLADKSLVTVDLERAEPRYSLLESARYYAREKLVARDEQQLVAASHARAYLEIAERLESTYDTDPDDVWISRAQYELDNWRAALEWSLGKGRDVALGLRLAAALGPVWMRRAAVEGRRWIRMALEAAAADAPPSVVARLELADANVAMHLTLWKHMLSSARRALGLFEQVGDRRGTAEAKIVAGRALALLGRPQEAEALLRTSLEMCQTLGIVRLTGTALESLAMARMTAGDLAGSRPLYLEALSVFADIQDEQSIATVSANLAGMEFRAGNPESALRLAQDALVTQRATNNPRVALLLCNISAYLVATRRFDEARDYAREGLTLAEERHMEVQIAWAVQHLAAIAALRHGEVQSESAAKDRRRAARILGFVDARLIALETSRKYTEQQERDALLTALREAIGAAALDDLMAAGAAMSEDRAVEESLYY
ncbi:MAG TPA: tetratricopeptide repeat protein, partial [Candidatus Tumulicola sp.]